MDTAPHKVDADVPTTADRADQLAALYAALWASVTAESDRSELSPAFVEAYGQLRVALNGLKISNDKMDELIQLLIRHFGRDWDSSSFFSSSMSMHNNIRMRIERVGGVLAEPLNEAEAKAFANAVRFRHERPKDRMELHLTMLRRSREARGVDDAGVDWEERTRLFSDFIPHDIVF